MISDLLFFRNNISYTRESYSCNIPMGELTNENLKKCIVSINTKKFLRLKLISPVVRKYGVERTERLFSSKIFSTEDVKTTKEIIDIFSEGMARDLDAVLKMISELIDEGTIDLKTMLYAFAMGYDYTFTINLILQFYDLLKVMSNYKMKKISSKIDHKNMYSFLRELDVKSAEQSAKLIEKRDKDFFKRLNQIEVKLAYII